MFGDRLTLRQKEVLTGLVVLFVCFGSVGGADALLRIQQYLAFGGERNVEKAKQYYVDAATGLRLPAPNSNHGRLHYNSLGHRSPEIEVPKPAGTLRLAFMGSSTTLDPFVPRLESTWPHLVAKALDDAVPGCRVDYLNAGSPGFGTGALLTYFDAFIRLREPDVVVIMTNDQNQDLDALAIKAGISDGVHYRPSWLARNSLFWSKVEKNAVIIQRQRSAHSETGRLTFRRAELTANFRANLERLVGLVRETGALPVLLAVGGQLRADQSKQRQIDAAETDLFYMPYMSISGFLETRAAYNEAIDDIARRHDLPFIDWQSAVPGDAAHFIDSHHFKPAGSRAMADYLVRRLLADPAFSRLAASC